MIRPAVLLASLVAVGVLPAAGQGLEQKVARAADGSFQFHFPARSGVCGNGRGMLRSDDGSYYMMNSNDESCAAGPVRVVVVRAGKEVLRIETYAGPLINDPESGADLGAVPAKEASAWLLTLAGTLDGRPSRDVLLPATLADSSAVTPALLKIVQDQTRSRDIRRGAIPVLARRRSEVGGVGSSVAIAALDKLVHDQQESETLRQTALSAVSSLDRSEGIPILIRYADEPDSWVSRQAFSTLARSGDPRARRYTRDALSRPTLTDDNRVLAIQGVGGDYATVADLKILRDMYPSLNSDRQRDAVITSLSNAGGRDNIDWLLTLAKSPTETISRRKRVLSLLSRSDDPRVQAALKAMVEKP